MPERLLILADDFTGACDAAGAFGETHNAFVLLRPEAVHALDTGQSNTLLAVDLDVRERSDAIARAAVQQALGLAEAPRRIFVKIDSTLRGPIEGLITGALAGRSAAIAVIAPAFPEHNRLFDAGRLVLDGVVGARLSDIFPQGDTALISASYTRSADAVESAIAQAAMQGKRYIIVDADGSDSLRSVAQASARHPAWLLVGSAGLARQVADLTVLPAPSGSGDKPSDVVHADARLFGPVLVVAGSPAPATRAQLEHLEAAEQPPGLDIIVLATPRTAQRDNGEAVRGLAGMVAAWALQTRPCAVILAGGATARAVCEQLHADGVQIVGELAPGIPHGYVRGGIWHGVRVVTKAGAFGGPNVILDAVLALGVSSTADHD